MIKWVRFTLRLILLLVAIAAGALSVSFFYQFHTLTIDQISELLNILSSEPVLSMMIGVGLLLFVLSLLGFILLLQYQIWRYPLSIFLGYAVGAFIYYEFYTMHPLQDGILQLNNETWYYPFIMATALLLRAIIGLNIPSFKKPAISNN